MRLSRIAVTFASLILLATAAQATTYYVSLAGNDVNAGTAAAPFRTISKAASVARPGDTVYVRGGVYNEVVTISSKGTAAARIMFQSHPGETAVIDGTGSAPDTNLVSLNGAEYVDFAGFEVRNATRIGILGWGGRSIRILNNDVHHSVRAGIYVGLSTSGTATVSEVTIDGNRVHNNVLENQYHTWSGGWAQAIGLCRTAGARVTNNRVYQNDGEGIVFILSDNGLARGNEVSDNFSVGIYLDNARYTTVDANFIYSTADARYFRDGYPAAGIGSANEQYATSNPLTDLTITNNIVADTKWGFYYGSYGNGGGLKNATIANNTFYHSGVAMVWIQADANSNNSVRNNIFYQSGGGVMLSGSASGTLFARNNWYGGNAGAAAGVGDLIADPRLVNAGARRRTAIDYKLTALSPAIQAGLDLPSISTDFWGATRSANYDIGAHEYSGADGSTPIPTPPAAPTNVVATTISSTSIALSWTASVSTNVTGYRVYRGGVQVATVAATTWTNQGLSPSTTYSYTVMATDQAGNESAPASASATTLAAAPPGDTQAPSTPGALWASPSTSSTGIYLGWNASTDNVGVIGYKIYRNGSHVATVTATTWTDDSGLAHSTTYTYGVSAIDTAGNQSARATVSATTKSASKRMRTAAGH